MNLPGRKAFGYFNQELWQEGDQIVARADRIWHQFAVVLFLPIGGIALLALSGDPGRSSDLGFLAFLIFGLGGVAWLGSAHSEVRINTVLKTIRVSRGTFGIVRRHTFVYPQIDSVSMITARNSRSRKDHTRIGLMVGGKRYLMLLTEDGDVATDLYRYLRHDLGFAEADEDQVLGNARDQASWFLMAVGAIVLAVGWAYAEAQFNQRGPLESSMGPWLRQTVYTHYRGGGAALVANGDEPRMVLITAGTLLLVFGVLARYRRGDE